MFSPAYEIAKADAAVRAAFGDPPRFSDFGESEQDGARPYAVHQVVYGNPENYLNQTPDADNIGVQVDVYGLDMKATKAAARVLRNAFESGAYVTGYGVQAREFDTKLYRVSFTVEFKTDH
jgi:hypothetical protein